MEPSNTIIKYIATVQSFYIAIVEINTNMYEYMVNKHAFPTDVILQSVYEVQ